MAFFLSPPLFLLIYSLLSMFFIYKGLCLNGETVSRPNCFPRVEFEDILVSPHENYIIFASSNRKGSNSQHNNRKFFRIHNDNYEASESEQMNIGSQRILVSDHINTYQYSSEKIDSFVIDMDSFSSTINKDITNANSRTTKSLSRKGSQHWGDRNVNGNVTLQDKDTVPTERLGSYESMIVVVGSTQNSTNPPQQVHHQTTLKSENKCITRRSKSFSSWLHDPKKVLVFARMSSAGTLLLIYLTLTISKKNEVQYWGDLQ